MTSFSIIDLETGITGFPSNDFRFTAWGGNSRPIFALSGLSTIWLAYTRTKSAVNRLRILYSTDLGANWTEDALLTYTSQAEGFSLKGDPSGTVHLMYCVGTGGIVYRSRTSPGVWTSELRVDDATSFTFTSGEHQDMAVSSDGKVHIFGSAIDGTTSQRRPFYITNSSGSWVTSELDTSSVSPNHTWSRGANIICDQYDSLHVAIPAQFAGVSKLFYSKKTSGGSFADYATSPSSWEEVDSGKAYNVSNDPQIFTDGGTTLFISQTDDSASAQSIRHYKRNSNGTWTATVLLNAGSGTPLSFPNVGYSQDGFAHSFYLRTGVGSFPSRPQVAYMRYNPVTSPSGTEELVTNNDEVHGTAQQSGICTLFNVVPFIAFGGAGIPGAGACGFYPESVAAATNNWVVKFVKTSDFAIPDISGFISESAPNCPAEPDRSSKALTGEGAAAASYPQTPDLVFEERERFSTRKVESEHGYETTHARFATSRRLWTAHHLSVSKSVRDTILAFIEARLGANEAFNFTLVETGGTVKVRFVPETIRAEKKAPGVYDLSFQVEELLT